MSNDDVNAVILRFARTLQRCGEDPRAIFSALIGAAATLSSDIGHEVNSPADLRRAIDEVVETGHLAGFRSEATTSSSLAPKVIPFRPSAKVA